jgi:hypothetical protein
MSSPLHSKQTQADGIHSAIAYVYADQAERLAASGFTPEDVYKLAYQQSDASVWLLVNTSPITWVETFNSGVGISLTQHPTLRQLVHLADEGGPFEGFPNCVRDIGPAGSAFPTSSIWWTDSSRQYKIVEKVITYNSNKTPATIQWKVYASGSNVVVASFTDTITYQGVFEISRTRSSP